MPRQSIDNYGFQSAVVQVSKVEQLPFIINQVTRANCIQDFWGVLYGRKGGGKEKEKERERKKKKEKKIYCMDLNERLYINICVLYAS